MLHRGPRLLRLVGRWLGPAEARLINGAIRNVVVQLVEVEQRRLEDARTLRDVRRLRPATS